MSIFLLTFPCRLESLSKFAKNIRSFFVPIRNVDSPRGETRSSVCFRIISSPIRSARRPTAIDVTLKEKIVLEMFFLSLFSVDRVFEREAQRLLNSTERIQQSIERVVLANDPQVRRRKTQREKDSLDLPSFRR